MPGVEVADVPLMTPTLERPLLKAHKALPRRRDIILLEERIRPIQILSSDQDTEPQKRTAVATAPALPLTPPGKTREEYNRNESDRRNGASFLPEHQTMGVVTPPHQRSPPTPDITPPRATSLSLKAGPCGPVQASMSSRAESFKTAREAFSDEDTEGTNRSTHSLRPSKQRLSPKKPTAISEVEFPSDIFSRQGATSTLKYRSDVEQVPSFDSFDGEWINGREGESATSPSSQKRNNTRGYRPNKNTTPQHPNTSGVDAQVLEASLNREKSLRDRVRDSRKAPASPSTEKFGEDIGWISTEDPVYISERVNSWRLSAASTSSTAKAMVIDSPPQAKRILRHTEKKSSLRSASSPLPQSNRTSLVSSAESQHRLVHKAARITNYHRWSITSDISVSTSVTSSAVQRHPEIIPVVVIPERRSSLKSSASSSRNQSKTRSRASSRRPTTAPYSRNGSLDLPRQKKRTMSDSVPSSSRSRDIDLRGRGIGRPQIPQRSSSLSAPTSRNTSRAASLTSESLQRHTLAMELENQKRDDEQQKQPPSSHDVHPVSHHTLEASNRLSAPHAVDDTFTLRPPSLPFTQPSVQSSSPGPVEISEATAVSLFPHNNESLLLVDQNVLPESHAVQALRIFPAYIDGREGARTPEISSQPATADVDSPLRNPRPPPKPPAFKIIPPTPMDEAERQLGEPENNQEASNGLARRFGSVRRALTARRRSEFSTPFTWSFSTKSARNRKAGQEMDSRLHPFWRPRGFWDDFSDSEDEDSHDNDAASVGDRGASDMIVNNSLGMPQKRVIFNGPLSLVRRIQDPTRSRPERALYHGPSRSSLVGRRGLGSGIFRPRSPYNQRRFRAVSLFGLRFRFVTLRDLQQRLRRAREQREKEKWDARREQLKQSIGDRILVDSSTSAGNARNRGAVTIAPEQF